MKPLLLLLLINLFACNLQAEVRIKKGPAFSKKENKIVTIATKRAATFYNWYVGYLKTNNSRPLQHLVIDQYTTAHMRDAASNATGNYDAFMATNGMFSESNIDITPQKIEAGRISLLLNTSGKYNYSFYVDMVIQRGNWCIDIVASAEDMNPQLSENE